MSGTRLVALLVQCSNSPRNADGLNLCVLSISTRIEMEFSAKNTRIVSLRESRNE